MQRRERDVAGWILWLGVGLWVIPALFLIAVQIRLPFQLNLNEGWNAYHATFVRAGSVLYPEQIDWWVSNYPPVSFWLSAALAPLAGGSNLAGRIANVGGVALLSLAVGWMLSHRLGRSWGYLGGAFSFFYFAFVLSGYVAVNDPQMTGLGLVFLGFCFSCLAPHTGRNIFVGAALIAAGCGVKHNLVTVLLVAGLHLWLTDRRRAFTWSWQVAALGFLGLGFCHLLYGQAFWGNLISKRGYSFDSMKQLVRVLLQTAAVPLGLALVYCLRCPLPLRKDYLIPGMLIGGLAGTAFAGGSVALNVYYELIIFSLIASLIVLAQLFPDKVSLAQMVLLPLPLLITSFPELVNYPSQLKRLPETSQQAREQLRYLKDLPGPAICDNLLLCHEAGQPLEIDLYWTLESMRAGRLAADALNPILASGKYATIELDLPPGTDPAKPFSYFRFPDAAVPVLLEHYEVARIWPYRVFYRKKQSPAVATNAN